MIFALIVMQVMQPQPAVRTTPLLKANPVISRLAEPRRELARARELLARAETVRAEYVPVAGQPTRAELDASIEQLKNDVDSMSEMGEQESLRLQMAMDRMSKMMS